MKEQDLNEKEISGLSDKQFKIMIIKMITRSGEQSMNKENFNKGIENIRKYQLETTEWKNIITKLKDSTAD